MIKYKVISTEQSITLNIMGRTKVFIKDDEVFEDVYTNTYPQYFKRLGEVKGYDSFLSTPVFIPDTIQEFIQKEEKRSEKTVKQMHINPSIKEVEIDEIVSAIEEHIESKYNVEIDDEELDNFVESIVDETFDENDVKVETEEN